MHVTIGRQYVHRKGDDQQTGRGDMGGLEIPVTRPEPRAGCSPGGQGQKDQCEERQKPCVFVAGRSRLHMLDDPLIDRERRGDMDNRGGEYQPAEQLVAAQPEGTGGAGAWPHREDAEDEAAGDGAQAQSLRKFPRQGGRRHLGLQTIRACRRS